MKKRKIIRGRRQNRFEKTKTVLAAVIIFGLIFGMGSMALFIGFQDVIGAFSSSGWPSVAGTITHSEISVTEERTSKSSPGRRDYSFYADIKYEYSLGETPITGERIRFGQVYNKEIAEILVNRYRPGKEVQVYYDPDNLENSVLEPGVTFGLLLWPILGLIAIGCGVLGVFIFFKFLWDP